MKKMKQIIAIIMIALVIINVFAVISNASDPFSDPDEYNPNTPGQALGNKNDKFVKSGSVIIGALRAIGSGVSVITLMALGIKYMLGSVEERADYKKSMIPYIIGAVMIFAISTILGVLLDASANLGI